MNNIIGTTDRPRVSVFRSNRFLSGQAIDDSKNITIAAVSTKGIDKKTPVEKATAAGDLLGQELKKKKIEKIVFDRNGLRYHGQVAAFADALRKSGIIF